MTAPKPTLPRIPSQLIAIALEDLEKVEAMSGTYQVNMVAWHEPGRGGTKCFVCAAGAVMAMRLDVSPTASVSPWDFDPDTCAALRAINYLRGGDVDAAFATLGLPSEEGVRFIRRVPYYRTDPAASKSAMRQLAADLKAAGY